MNLSNPHNWNDCMATVTTAEVVRSVADLLAELGDIPPERVRVRPPLGLATKQDVIDLDRMGERPCELVDGVLVEKAMGWKEAILATVFVRLLGDFIVRNNLGFIAGPDGTVELWEGLVRIPDIAFVSWERLPGGAIPNDPIPEIAPDLAIEVLSHSNTPREMQRKRAEYFQAGVRLVWIVDHPTRTIHVYTSPEDRIELSADDTLDGGDVLPGFAVAVRDIFAELDRKQPS